MPKSSDGTRGNYVLVHLPQVSLFSPKLPCRIDERRIYEGHNHLEKISSQTDLQNELDDKADVNNAIFTGNTTIVNFVMGGQTISDVLISTDGASTSDTAFVTPGWIDANITTGGDVTGPASSTDNAICRYDGTTGKLIQDSGVTIDDGGNMFVSGGMTAVALFREISTSGLVVGGGTSAANGAFITLPSDTLGGEMRIHPPSGESVSIEGDLTTDNLPAPNLLINADGTDPVNQRGIGASDSITSNDYTFDRWFANHNVNVI